MDRFDDDTLLAELRELRPTPRPEFTAELDERAAAGFPRRPSRAGAGPIARLVDWIRGASARRLLVPAVGLTIAVLAVAVVVVAIGTNGGSGGDLMTSAMSESESVSGGAAEMSEAGEEEGAGTEARSAPQAGTHAGRKAREGGFSGNFFGESGKSGAKQAQGTVHGGAVETEESAPAEEAGGAGIEEETAEEAAKGPAFAPATNGAVKTHGQRDVERSTSMVLGTKPGEVAGAAAKVYTAVHAANGIVLNSSVESGRTGPTGASFSLLIPSHKVDGALAAFSQIAEVRSRHDATTDITAPTVGVTEELRDSNASIEGLLKELGNVETEAERESVEARLREERRHHAAIRASLEHLHKRASMSEVSLRIVTSHGAGVVAPPAKGDGGWSVGDALHDAGQILTVAAGVLLIALAILAPIALIALLIWSLNRFRVRRLRERALG
jgi:Domain of unknown function (DUF4349)